MMAIKSRIQAILREHRASVVAWMILPFLLLGAYHFLSDGDFSFMLTAGAIVRAFSFVLLGFKILTEKTARDVSQKALTAYVVAFAARFFAISLYEGYLPYDRSGDHVYKLAEFTSLAMAGACLFMTATRNRNSYNVKADCFGNMPFLPTDSPTGVLLIIFPCLMLALALHPSLNSSFVADTMWAYACYLETMAMLPQLTMIRSGRKSDNSQVVVVEPYTAHWMFSLAVARLYMLCFWVYTYHELHLNGGLCGFAVLGFQALQLVFMMEYIYYYIRSAAKGEDINLPVLQTLSQI